MRYDFAPLEALVLAGVGPRINNIGQHASPTRLVAEALSVDRRQVIRWRQIGVTADQADRLAVATGFVPYEVWPEWIYDAMRPCQAQGCLSFFVPHTRQPAQRWCSTLCRKREWAREQYRSNPQYAEAERARSNAYYAEWKSPFRPQRTASMRYTSGEKTVVPASRQRPGTVADPSREGADNARP